MTTLDEVTAACLRALAASRVPYALAGGLASNVWVLAEHQQATFDADFAILSDDAADVAAYLERRLARLGGFRSATLTFPKVVIERLLCRPDILVDLVQLKDRTYARTALARSSNVTLRGAPHPVLVPEDVIIYY